MPESVHVYTDATFRLDGTRPLGWAGLGASLVDDRMVEIAHSMERFRAKGSQEAEMMAALLGLTLAHREGLERVVLVVDNSSLLHASSRRLISAHAAYLEVELAAVHWIKRGLNRRAHRLAEAAYGGMTEAPLIVPPGGISSTETRKRKCPRCWTRQSGTELCLRCVLFLQQFPSPMYPLPERVEAVTENIAVRITRKKG